MATYRNKSSDTLEVPVQFRTFLVPPDDTFDVPDELAESYDLNDNLVRVDTPAVPAAPEMSSAPAE